MSSVWIGVPLMTFGLRYAYSVPSSSKVSPSPQNTGAALIWSSSPLSSSTEKKSQMGVMALPRNSTPSVYPIGSSSSSAVATGAPSVVTHAATTAAAAAMRTRRRCRTVCPLVAAGEDRVVLPPARHRRLTP